GPCTGPSPGRRSRSRAGAGRPTRSGRSRASARGRARAAAPGTPRAARQGPCARPYRHFSRSPTDIATVRGGPRERRRRARDNVLLPTTGALGRELVHPAGVDRAGVELSARVLAERRQAADRDRLAPHVRRRAVDHAQAPDLARAVVAE